MENYELIVSLAKEQEDMLRFERFTAEDAWALGCLMAARVKEAGIDMALAIRKLNGHILFQYCTQGTALNNQNWMRRKFNTVVLTEGSSLRHWAATEIKGQSMAAQGLDPLEYALCGGGFPIRLKSGELVGVITASNLPHKQDHAFIVSSLAAHLGMENVPQID